MMSENEFKARANNLTEASGEMTREELQTVTKVCYWEFGKPVEAKLTGRIIRSPTDNLTMVEVRSGWFTKKWVYLPQLDVISNIGE